MCTMDGPSETRPPSAEQPGFSRSIDWYAQGQGRVVEVNGIRLTVRLVDRKGRKARIAITAPPNSVFADLDSDS